MNVILEKAVEVKADAIGLSALLVSTSKQMPICVQEQDARGLNSRSSSRRGDQPRLRTSHRAARRRRTLLRTRFFYAKDAFEGLELMDTLTSGPERRSELVERLRTESFAQRDRVPTPGNARRDVDHLGYQGSPATCRCRILGAQPWTTSHWRRSGRTTICAASTALVGAQREGRRVRHARARRVRTRLERYRRESAQEGWLQPRAVTGIFRRPASATTRSSTIRRIRRGDRAVRVCATARRRASELADYLREPEEGRGIDVVALQLVTVVACRRDDGKASGCGRLRRVVFRARILGAAAEALAEATHHRIRRELGIRPIAASVTHGLRRLPRPVTTRNALPVTRRGEPDRRNADECLPIVPEQSTAAIVIHHPEPATLTPPRPRGNRV